MRAARAAHQLSDVLWEALQEELGDPDTGLVKELSQRLADVSSTVALLVGSSTGSSASRSNASGPDAARSGLDLASGEAPGGESDARGVQRSEEPPAERRKPPVPSRPQVAPPVALQPIPTSAGEYTFTKLVDEQESGAAVGEPRAPARSGAAEQEQHAPVQPLATVEPIQPEIEIRDVRREEGPSAWVSSVGRLLVRHAEDGLPFAVLLIEIVDVARLERSATPHDLHGLVAQVEEALGRGMRATDGLSRETLGRYWLVAPETNGTGARMLAERLARLVRTSASHRNVPMEVAIGIAVCPDDGTEAPALAARADLGVYSARATGRSIAHTDPPAAS